MYPTFTKQETFDIVAKHLLAQNKKSITGVMCQYRGPNGLKCAAGALIPDEDYTAAMDNYSLFNTVRVTGNGISSLRTNFNLQNWFGHDLDLITRLQSVHDNAEVGEWENELRDTARIFGLTVNF